MKEQVNGHIWINTFKYGEENTETHEVLVPQFPEGVSPAKVSIGAGITKNLGNYESARVDVRIEMPALPEETEIARVASMVSEWVDEILGEKVSKVALDG